MGHKDLDVWKESMELVTEIYRITNAYPKTEQFGLVSQIRRAAISIPSNVSEGAARNHPAEYIQFLHIAIGSLAELETQLIISKNLSYIDDKTIDIFDNRIKLIRTQLSGLIKYLKEKK